MTTEDDDPFTTIGLGELARALDAQHEHDEDGGRAEVLDCLRRLGGAPTGDAGATTAGILDLVAESSLGAPPDEDGSGPVDPLEVAGVLDRLDAADREADDAVAAWTGEFVRLCRAAAGRGGLPIALDGADELTGVVERPALFAGRTLELPRVAERAVEALGASWADSGFRALYQAARRTRRRAGHSAVLQLSGLGGVSMPDRDTALAWIEAPVDGLPLLRGRERSVARLVSAIERRVRRVQVLHGPGGYGKTTLALTVAARVRSDGRPVLRVPAPDLDELVDGLYLAALSTGATARGLELAMQAEPVERAERLWRLLDASPVPWVIVLDDVGADLAGGALLTRGSSGGSVLITTRHGDPAVWAGCDVVELERLSVEQGGLVVQDLIEPGRPRAGMAARALSRLLGGVPLALATAGRLAASARTGDGRLTDLARRIGRLEVDNPLSTVYEIGVAGSDELRSVIRLLACFAPDEPLPLSVLDAYPDVVGAPAPSVPDLLRTGLVDLRLRSGRRCLRIHPAHAEQSRRDPAITDAEADTALAHAVDLLTGSVRRIDAGAPAGWPLLRLLEPHVAQLLADRAVVDEDVLARTLRLAERTAAALLRSGDQVAAAALLDEAGERAMKLEERHPARVDLRHTRAWTIALDGGDFALAERELRAVLALRTEALGPAHPHTLSTRDRLAWVIAERGRPEQAHQIASEVLAVRRAELGPTHPHTLSTRHRLAWIDGLLGRDQEALAGFTEVLAQRRERLGAAHLDVYSSHYRLAWALGHTTAFERAETVYRELQSELEQTVGPEHPLTLMVRVRVGWVLVWRGRFDDAEQHYADVLADQERVLGADHLRVLRTRHLQACLALNRGDVATAIERMRAVVEAREDRLGADHHHTLASRSYLAEAYLQAGQVDAADREWQAVLADRQRVLGELHPITLITRYWLARARLRRGRLDEAQQMVHRLIEDQRGVIPPENRWVFNARHALAMVNGRRGRLSTAEQQLRDVLADRTRVLGHEHRDTLAARHHLAAVLGRLGRVEEGIAETTAVLEDRIRVLGPRHPHTLASRYRLARLANADPSRDDAEQLVTELLDDTREILGEDHPDTLRCRHMLVRMRREAGHPESAARYARELLADQVRVRGEDAVATLRTADELGRALLEVPGSEATGRMLLDDVLARRARALGEDHPDTVRLRGFLAGPPGSGDSGGSAV